MSEKNITMSLQDFVKTALEQIHEGMAGKKIANGSINIQFEVGVEVAQAAEAKTSGGLGLNVVSILRLGTNGQSANASENKTYNKLSFTIPLLLSFSDKTEHKDEVKSMFSDPL